MVLRGSVRHADAVALDFDHDAEPQLARKLEPDRITCPHPLAILALRRRTHPSRFQRAPRDVAGVPVTYFDRR